MDVRVIAACNADLPQYVRDGKFRKDLYYRLSTFPLHIPPLRERPADISPLAHSILNELSHKLRRPFTLTVDAAERLRSHDWPGNVRELRNVLEFSAYLTPSGIITADALPGDLGRHKGDLQTDATLAQRVRAFEQREIRKVLEKHGSSLDGKKKAAAELGISLSSLYNKLGSSPA